MLALDPVSCATCELEIGWPPVEHVGRPYCCEGCAAGGPCTCSYDQRPHDYDPRPHDYGRRPHDDRAPYPK